MSKHMPEVPIANRSKKGPGDHHEVPSDTTHNKHPDELNTSEQGDTANIKQNTTNKGFFRKTNQIALPVVAVARN
jgi:hypothetical protein